MSRKDALRSYRRAVRKAYRLQPNGQRVPATHPLMVEMGKRGDRLHRVFRFDAREEQWRFWCDDAPVEVVDAMTSVDVRELAEMELDEKDARND